MYSEFDDPCQCKEMVLQQANSITPLFNNCVKLNDNNRKKWGAPVEAQYVKVECCAEKCNRNDKWNDFEKMYLTYFSDGMCSGDMIGSYGLIKNTDSLGTQCGISNQYGNKNPDFFSYLCLFEGWTNFQPHTLGSNIVGG